MILSTREFPLISVVIPCFKQAQFLAEAMLSVVAQSYPHWECIVVNDGSPDHTSAVARQIIAAYPNLRIRLLEKENDGLAEARNSAIAQARGEWIAPLDADDAFYPQYFEKVMLLASTKPETNHVTGWLELFGAESRIVEYRGFDRSTHLIQNLVPYCALYKRVLWERVGGYLPIIPYGAEDWNFTVTCSPWLVTARVPEPLVRYRRHAGGSMVSGVEAHHGEVNACLHSLHPDKYPPEALMIDHTIIGSAAPETCAQIESTIDRYPSFSQPYLWRALQRRRKGKFASAIRDFFTAARLDQGNDWQPWFWLTISHAEMGNSSLATTAAQETLRRCPNHPTAHLFSRLIETELRAAVGTSPENADKHRTSRAIDIFAL